MTARVLPAPVSARVLSAFAILLFLSAHTSFAQIDTGAIVGTVRDSSAAAIPRASVTLSNAATGIKQSTTTNDAGEYQFMALPPGV